MIIIYSAAVATAIFSAKASWGDLTVGRSLGVNVSCVREITADLGTGEAPDDPFSMARSEVKFDDLHEKKRRRMRHQRVCDPLSFAETNR